MDSKEEAYANRTKSPTVISPREASSEILSPSAMSPVATSHIVLSPELVLSQMRGSNAHRYFNSYRDFSANAR